MQATDESPRAARVRQSRENTPVYRAARIVGVSPRMVELARKVARDGIPEWEAAIMGGERFALTSIAEVVRLPHDAQRAILAGGPKAVARKAKEIRAAIRAGQPAAFVLDDAQPETPVAVRVDLSPAAYGRLKACAKGRRVSIDRYVRIALTAMIESDEQHPEG